MNDIAWSEFTSKLHTYVRRRVGVNAVDDVVSDILLRLIGSQDKMAGAKNPLAWATRIASNVIVDHYRRAASEKRLLEGAHLDPTNISQQEQDEQGLARCLTPMIKSLPAPYNQALLLTDIEGLSQVAAAKQLGLSVSGMKSRVQRGRQKLKSALLKCCEIEVNRRGDVVDFNARGPSKGCRAGNC